MNLQENIKRILREEIITAPPFSFFAYDWNEVLEYAEGKLFRIGGNIDLSESDITTLSGLVEVGGNLALRYCYGLESLNNLKYVSGNLYLWGCRNILSLSKLGNVGGHLNLYYCQNLQSLGGLKTVGGYLDLVGCERLESFGELKSVDGNLWLNNSRINDTMEDDEIRSRVDIKGAIKR